MTESFVGFPREMPDFLLSLAFHNSLESLEENKEKYRCNVAEPLRALYGELSVSLESKFPQLRLDTRPHRCMSGMYNDMRFSKEKHPIKDYCYLRFKLLGSADRGFEDIPGFYFDMGAADYSYGIRFYHQSAPGMRALREAITRNEQEFLSILMENGVMEHFALRGMAYAKDPCPQKPEPLHGWLSLRTLYLHSTHPVGRSVFNRELFTELESAFSSLGPLMLFLQRHLA